MISRQLLETFSGPSQISMAEFFAKIINDLKSLAISAISYIIYGWHDVGTSVLRYCSQKEL